MVIFFITAGLVILALIFLVLMIFFMLPFLFGAPYDISRKESLENIVKLTDPKPGDKIAELGSGDGRVCIALALNNPKPQRDLIIHGYEINPFLVIISRRKIKKLHLQNKIKIYWRNFWNINLSKYNKVILFQFSTIMKKMEKKINSELKKGSKIISHNWTFPNIKPKKILGHQKLLSGKVYLYEK